MHYLDHLLECLIGPSFKVLQLRRLFDWTNMAAALHQFFGAARHPCFEVSGKTAGNVNRPGLSGVNSVSGIVRPRGGSSNPTISGFI